MERGRRRERRDAFEDRRELTFLSLLPCIVVGGTFSQLYVNISFSGLGALLDLAPVGAESMARKMIEQERLRGWIE